MGRSFGAHSLVTPIFMAAKIKNKKAKAEKGKITEKEIRAWALMDGGFLAEVTFVLSDDLRWSVENAHARPPKVRKQPII